MNKILFTCEEKYLIHELYFSKKLSLTKIGMLFGCSGFVISKYIKNDGYIIRSASEAGKRWFINEDYFDSIDTEDKAYWLGYLYADGCNNEKFNKVRLSLAENDKLMVEKFSYAIFNCIRTKKYSHHHKNVQDLIYVTVCNKHISEQLAKLGCIQNKTFVLTFPMWLKEGLYRHFIRGYFDGDGCISIYKRNNSVTSRASLEILSTFEFLTFIAEYLKLHFKINSSFSKRHKERNNNNYTFKISDQRQIESFLTWLYCDATIYLERKYDKYIELVVLNAQKTVTNMWRYNNVKQETLLLNKVL